MLDVVFENTIFVEQKKNMTPGQQHWAQYWEKTRTRGRTRFILLTALRWSLTMGIFLNLFLAVMARGTLDVSVLQEAFWSRTALLRLGVWLLGGLGYALTMWYLNERSYRGYQKS